MHSLDLETPEQTPKELTKSAFAKRHGLTNGRISQMIGQGMPTLPNGRVEVEAADAWISANINRRSSSAKQEAATLSKVKQEREEAQRDLLRLQLAEKERRLIDRKGVELALFERARAERDAHLAWIARLAPKLASELDIDLSKLFAALDREMRLHLEELADTPLGDLAHDT